MVKHHYDTVIIQLTVKGTGASAGQTSLAKQPEVHKHRLKTHKNKNITYLYSRIRVFFLLSGYSAQISGDQREEGSKNNRLVKISPRRSHDPENVVTLQTLRKRWKRRLKCVFAGWMAPSRFTFSLFLTGLLSGGTSSSCCCLLCYPQIVWDKTGGRSANTPLPQHYHSQDRLPVRASK